MECSQAAPIGTQAGADPSNYTREFEVIAQRRKALREQMVFASATENRSPLAAPGALDILRAAAETVRTVLLSEHLTPGEKNTALALTVHAVHIEEGRYRLALEGSQPNGSSVNQGLS